MRWFRSQGEFIKVLISIIVPLCSATAFIVISIYGMRDDLSKEMNNKFEKVDERLANVEKDIGIIKTILIANKILPNVYTANDLAIENKP